MNKVDYNGMRVLCMLAIWLQERLTTTSWSQIR